MRHRAKPSLTKEIAITTSLQSHPLTPLPVESQKENQPPVEKATEQKVEEEQDHSSHAAPLEKLASRMKSLLKRKNTGEKKAEKIEKRKKGYYDLDRVEDVHWTEM